VFADAYRLPGLITGCGVADLTQVMAAAAPYHDA
jgi:hypothetical protein